MPSEKPRNGSIYMDESIISPKGFNLRSADHVGSHFSLAIPSSSYGFASCLLIVTMCFCETEICYDLSTNSQRFVSHKNVFL